MLKRKVSPIKRPSTMRVGSRVSTLSQRNGTSASRGDASMPKTRFSLNDRSSSSPRLKSFPAEKIKRLEPEPLQNSQETIDVPRPMLNSGQGDTLQQPALHFYPQSQSFTMTNQNMFSMSEQQVPRTIYPVSNQVNQSELAIPSAMENSSTGRPAHRPFVPNAPQANMILPDKSPRKVISPRPLQTPQPVSQAQMPRTAETETQIQETDPWKIENGSPLHHAKEPVDGRSAAFHRGNVETHTNQTLGIRGQIEPQRAIGGGNVSNLGTVADPSRWHEPQQICNGHQSNPFHCCNHNGQIEMPGARIIEGHRGMTSPQDIAVDQSKNHQRPMQHGSYGWTTHPQSSWIQNQRVQIQPYSMDLVSSGVNVTPGSAMGYQNLQRGIQVPNSHQHVARIWQPQAPQHQQQQQQQQQQQHQQQQQQQQQYYHEGQISSTTPPQSLNAPKSLTLENQQRKDVPKPKPLRFTPPMIRDQEMLVTTMRQQGIPEEIMRRQFDALLAEQRKQLLYLEQLERGDTNGSDKLQQRRRVQRKISRIEEDGKPEWMLHITPPRIPYSTFEKMRYEREVDSQQPTQSNGNAFKPTAVYVHRQICDQTTQGNCSQPWQMSEKGTRQQQTPHAYVCNNSNAAKQIQECHVNSGVGADQGQIRYYGYPVQHQQQEQPQQHIQQVQENWPLQGQDGHPREEHRQPQRYEDPEVKVEPSSLPKLRLYKEVVRKQKQNNGLQDPETVKEAMEALKNPANRKGLEYLENLNRRREKPLSLNGAQDPQENVTFGNTPEQQYVSLNCRQAKMPSANGLENQRNPNNPAPTSNLRQRKLENPHFAEYPRQRSSNVSRDCYSLMAERENGTVANSTTKDDHRDYNSAMQYQMGALQANMPSRSENGFQFPVQVRQNNVYGDRKMTAARCNSMPLAFDEQNRPHFYAPQMQQYYGNRDQNGQIGRVDLQPAMVAPTGFSTGATVDGSAGNILHEQQRHYYYPCKNNDLHEVIMIGGIKYLARKPEYNKNPSTPLLHRDQMISGQHFNPMIPCQ